MTALKLIEGKVDHRQQSLSPYAFVRHAEYRSQRFEKMLSFVLANVRLLVGIDQSICTGTTLNIPKNSGNSVLSVRRVSASEPVYDLTVAHGNLPEFFANGILTHNSSDGEIRVFYDSIHAAQEDHLRDPLQTVIDIVQLSECGDIDPSIRFGFEPLWAMSERERAEVEKLEAETDQVRVDSGVLSPIEVRGNVASDPDSRYPGLDVEDAPDLSAEEAEGLQPKGQTGQDALDAMFDAAKGS